MNKSYNGLEWDRNQSWPVPSLLAATPKEGGSDRNSQPVAPSSASRSVQRRIAAQKGKPAPTFDAPVHELTRSEAIWLLTGWSMSDASMLEHELAYWNRQSNGCLISALDGLLKVSIHD